MSVKITVSVLPRSPLLAAFRLDDAVHVPGGPSGALVRHFGEGDSAEAATFWPVELVIAADGAWRYVSERIGGGVAWARKVVRARCALCQRNIVASGGRGAYPVDATREGV